MYYFQNLFLIIKQIDKKLNFAQIFWGRRYVLKINYLLNVICEIIYNGWNFIPFYNAQSSLRTLWPGLYDEFVSTVVRGGFKLKWRGFENHRKYIRFVVASPTTFFFSTLCCLFKVFPLVEFYSKGLDEKVFNLSQDAIPAFFFERCQPTFCWLQLLNN